VGGDSLWPAQRDLLALTSESDQTEVTVLVSGITVGGTQMG